MLPIKIERHADGNGDGIEGENGNLGDQKAERFLSGGMLFRGDEKREMFPE